MSIGENSNRLQNALLAITLQTICDQISVANRGRKFVKRKHRVIPKKPVTERFQSKVHESVYYELDPFQEAMCNLNEIKQQKDIFFIQNGFWKTILEIMTSTSCSYLEENIKISIEEDKQEEELMREYNKNEETYRSLNKRLTKRVSHAEMQMHISDDIIASLKNDLDNYKRLNDLEMSLVTKWEQTRFDQAAIMHENEEKSLKQSARTYTIKNNNEQRIIHDIENYNKLQMEDFKVQIVSWQKRYREDLDELLKKIKETNVNIIEVRKEHEKLDEIHQSRQLVINEYRERKAREQKEIEFQQKRINSAIKIQAWWRGVMVRKCLGPYRKKKKGKKGKKGK